MSVRELTELAMRVADLERRAAGSFMHGPVAEVDTATKRVRLDLGEASNGGRFLSPWVAYSQWAGALNIHTPPTVGQQFTMLSPGGDFQQAVAIPLAHSDLFPSPSPDADDENIGTYGNVRIEIRDEQTILTVGDEATVDVTTDTITVSHTGSTVEITADRIQATQDEGTVTMEGGEIVAEQGASSVTLNDGNIDAEVGGATLHMDSGNIRAEKGSASVDIVAGKIEVKAPIVIIS